MEAERSYVRRVMRELEGEAHDEEKETALREKHPRLRELLEKYASENLQSGGSGGTMAAEMLQLTFINLSSKGTTGGSSPAVKRVPATLTISRLKLMIKQMFAVPIPEQALSYRNDKDGIPVPLDDEDATLAYYGVTNEADIFVSETS